MAAYAALVSLMHTIDQIQHHPHPPISLDNKQVECLTENIIFLQDFLEGCSFHASREADDSLERYIADTAHEIEDIIESHIVQQILSRSAEHDTRSFEKWGTVISRTDESSSIDKGKTIVTHTEERSSVDKGKTIGCVDFIRGLCKASTHKKDEISSSAQPQILGRSTEDEISSPAQPQILGGSTEDETSSPAQPQIRGGSSENEINSPAQFGRSPDDEISSIFYQSLQKVIEYMDWIKKEVMEIKEMRGVQDQLQSTSMPSSSSRSGPTGQNTMVSFDGYLYEMLDKLTGGQSDRQIIPIVGMGGIGKTTLAHNIYVNPLIEEQFDIRAWATISQNYSMREILRDVLGKEDIEGMAENELGEMLYKHLFGRRYLIVLDDMWSIEAWDMIQFFFPNCNDGSRIVITTRLSNLASQLRGSSYSLGLELLDGVKSWELLCKTVFEDKGCPPELERIGKTIAMNCKGLPLSIVVIGGLLAKSKLTTEYWEYIAENLNSILSLEDDELCLKVLYMSYKQLPVHLKPCFLYMGVFPEDHVIRVSELIKLWVAEGFLKPARGKSLEEVAKEYFKDLVDRNLILVHKLGSTGCIKDCKIHDLLRDICLREAHSERFYHVSMQPSLINLKEKCTQRRIIIPESIQNEDVHGALQIGPLVRSVICDSKVSFLSFPLLRIFSACGKDVGQKFFLDKMSQLVNLRCIAVKDRISDMSLPSLYLLWNLQTLVVSSNWGTFASAEVVWNIWNMPQLRHVEFTEGLYLPDPPSQNIDERAVISCNLQTLMTINNFICSKEVAERIPNIKKLGTEYSASLVLPPFFNSFDHLQKLESLCCVSHVREPDLFQQNLNFPHSLKKLSLIGNDYIFWEDIVDKIGSLPLLEKFIFRYGSFKRPVWETVEGQFCSLKFLKILGCYGLESWKSEYSHFPRLEHLVLEGLLQLEEIPSDIGKIATLQSIIVHNCRDSAVISAKKILEEQEELGEVSLQIRVGLGRKNESLERLASPNFYIHYGPNSDDLERGRRWWSTPLP